MPAVVDLAAMRDAMRDLGGDPARINPQLPAELVIDHSVQVDVYASPLAVFRNTELEFERNRERYAFLRWGQQAFENFSVVPPSDGNRPPGQPRVPGPRRRGARGRRPAAGVPGHARRHRLAHDDGQRARRARLGRRRDRGRGGHARRGDLDARAAGRRLQAHGRAARSGRPRPTSSSPSRRSSAASASSGSSSSTSATAWPRCRWPTAPRSGTCHPSTAPPAASSPSTSARSSTCA